MWVCVGQNRPPQRQSGPVSVWLAHSSTPNNGPSCNLYRRHLRCVFTFICFSLRWCQRGVFQLQFVLPSSPTLASINRQWRTSANNPINKITNVSNKDQWHLSIITGYTTLTRLKIVIFSPKSKSTYSRLNFPNSPSIHEICFQTACDNSKINALTQFYHKTKIKIYFSNISEM